MCRHRRLGHRHSGARRRASVLGRPEGGRDPVDRELLRSERATSTKKEMVLKYLAYTMSPEGQVKSAQMAAYPGQLSSPRPAGRKMLERGGSRRGRAQPNQVDGNRDEPDRADRRGPDPLSRHPGPADAGGLERLLVRVQERLRSTRVGVAAPRPCAFRRRAGSSGGALACPRPILCAPGFIHPRPISSNAEKSPMTFSGDKSASRAGDIRGCADEPLRADTSGLPIIVWQAACSSSDRCCSSIAMSFFLVKNYRMVESVRDDQNWVEDVWPVLCLGQRISGRWQWPAACGHLVSGDVADRLPRGLVTLAFRAVRKPRGAGRSSC